MLLTSRLVVTVAAARDQPLLDAAAQQEMRLAYLGNLTWAAACDAVGLPFGALLRPEPEAQNARP